MRTDFLSRQRGWELEQARRAAELATGPEDEAMEAGVNMATVTQGRILSQLRGLLIELANTICRR